MTQSGGEGGSANTDIRMPPDVWGPIFWHAMHIVSLAYPVHPSEADKTGAKAFFESLTHVLPCPVCREHYKQKIATTPIDPALNSRGDLILWVWEIHNDVNVMLGKPTVTVDTFLEHMKTLGRGTGAGGACCKPDWPTLLSVSALGLLVGAGAMYGWLRMRR